MHVPPRQHPDVSWSQLGSARIKNATCFTFLPRMRPGQRSSNDSSDVARVQGPRRRLPVAVFPFHAPSQQNSHSVSGPSGVPHHRQTADIADDPTDSFGIPKLSNDLPGACKHPSDLEAPHLDREDRSKIRHPADSTRPIRETGCSAKGPPRVIRDFCRVGIGDR